MKKMFITFFVITVSKNVFVLPKIPELTFNCLYLLFVMLLLQSNIINSLFPSPSPSPSLPPSPPSLSPSPPLPLSFQVKTENNRLLRATACECLREVELAIPVSVR